MFEEERSLMFDMRMTRKHLVGWLVYHRSPDQKRTQVLEHWQALPSPLTNKTRHDQDSHKSKFESNKDRVQDLRSPLASINTNKAPEMMLIYSQNKANVPTISILSVGINKRTEIDRN